MSDLTAKFSTFEGIVESGQEETHSQLVTIESTLEAMQASLASINSDMLLMRRALASIGSANSPCIDCETQSVVVPPTTTVALEADENKCKRAQAFVDAVGRMLAVWDTFSTYDLAANFTLITSSISDVITELVTGETVPLPSFPEASRLAGDVIAYSAYNFVAHTSIATEYEPLKSSLVDAIYGSPDATSAKGEYDGIVGSGFSSGVLGELAQATAYNALWSFYFDPDSTPDLTPYDGTVCSAIGCFNINSQEACIGAFCRQYIVWPSGFDATTTPDGVNVWNKNVWLVGDYIGARITNTGVATKRLVYNPGPSQVIDNILPGTSYIFPISTTYILMDDSFSDGAFSIEFCTAGSFE